MATRLAKGVEGHIARAQSNRGEGDNSQIVCMARFMQSLFCTVQSRALSGISKAGSIDSRLVAAVEGPTLGKISENSLESLLRRGGEFVTHIRNRKDEGWLRGVLFELAA